VLLGDDSAGAEPYFCVVPTSELRIEDTWQTVGMRATGSHTFAAEDLFVPEYRMMPGAVLTEGAEVSFGALGALNLLGPVLGMGRGALALAIEKAPTKAVQHTFFARQSDSVGVQIRVAEAALMLDAARLFAYQAADQIDGAIADGSVLGHDGSARIRAQCGYAVQQVLEAIAILVSVHGAGSFAESNRMQQYWRDANTAARHAGLNATVGYEIFGKSLLGVQERITTHI
jgi:3-hydroxy-9,10-secoandrosta-1,3,5(10)-triene-9,17-dione monooxygenase